MRFARLILIAICGVVLNSCNSSAPTQPALSSINIVDRNGFSETISNADRLKQYEDVDFLKEQPYQKVLRIHSRDANGNIKAIITSYHPNGHPKQYLEVVNNRAFGAYREWHINGVLKLDTYIIGGAGDIDTSSEKSWLFDGCSRAWDERGNLVAEIPYKDGVLEGVSTYFHTNGAIWKLEPCHDGKIEGIYYVYLDNCQLLQSTEYAGGFKHGSAKRYWKEGVIAADEVYCEGYLTTGRYFDLCGALVCSIDGGEGYRATFNKSEVSEIQEYHKGILDGEVKVFGANGVLISRHHKKNGIKHGEEIEYYSPSSDGTEQIAKMSIHWSEGRIQGVVKTWYPDGNSESQREMLKNKKNGMLTAWYPDGSIMLMEEYDHGKLVRGEYFIMGEKIPISQISAGKGIATLFDPKGNLLNKVNYNNGKPLIE